MTSDTISSPKSGAKNEGLESAISRYGKPALLLMTVAILLSGYFFMSGVFENQKREDAWNAVFRARATEDKDLPEIQRAVAGTQAEAWLELQLAARAIDEDKFEEAEKHLAKIDQLPKNPLQGSSALLEGGANQSRLTDVIRQRIRSFQDWKKQNTALFENPPTDPTPKIRITTDQGEMVIGLYGKQAEKASSNIIKLCREGFYNDTRVSETQQGRSFRLGDPTSKAEDPAAWTNSGPGYDLTLDKNTLHHFKGSVSMVKLEGKESFSGSQFQICSSDRFDLDGQGVVFGKVIEGLDVAEKIGNISSEFKSEKLIPSTPIKILSMKAED